jgi:hypothetical protein
VREGSATWGVSVTTLNKKAAQGWTALEKQEFI